MKRNTNWKVGAGVALGASLLAGAAWATQSGNAGTVAQGCQKMMGGAMSMMSGSMSCCARKGDASQPAQATQDKDTQRATITIEDGYKPATVNAKAGKPLTLTFVSKGESCANAVHIPSLKQSFTLKKGEKKSITFTPQKGTTAFACGMGMYRGKVVAK